MTAPAADFWALDGRSRLARDEFTSDVASSVAVVPPSPPERWSVIRYLVTGAVVFAPLLIAASAQPALPKPGPDQKRMESYLGRWRVEGDAKASPYGPAAKFISVDTTEWLPGGFFFIHRFQGSQGPVAIKAMEVVGYDARRHVYTSQTFDSYGNAGAWTATVNGNTWTWSGNTEANGKHLKERCTVVFTAAATGYSVNCDWSEDGVRWASNFVAKATRLR